MNIQGETYTEVRKRHLVLVFKIVNTLTESVTRLSIESIATWGRTSWSLDLQLHVQSVPITTKVVSSNPAHDEVYSIQHDVIHFVSDLRQVDGFLRVLLFLQPIKLIATI
jgi:hypothetical protein